MSLARGLHLHFDCPSGIAGDMTLAAMLDLGVPLAAVEAAFEAVGIGKHRLRATRVQNHGIAAVRVDIEVDTPLGGGWSVASVASSPRPRVARGARDGSHVHHPYHVIRAMISKASLDTEVTRRALDIFDRIARAEAKLHGTPVDEVAFHEVGAIDSIADVVAAAVALAHLAPASVSCASVAMGHGTVTCAHGVLPVPSPAALEILREAGGMVCDGGVARELCTPTGAAILAHAVTAWLPCPPMTPVAVGWGAGHASLADRPNAVRIVLGAPAPVVQLASDAGDEGDGERLWQLECNLDDMNPEWLPSVLASSLAAGAVDVWHAPIAMKKGRQGVVLTALAYASNALVIAELWFRETTTLGVRRWPVDRWAMARAHRTVATPWGPVRVKLGLRGDGAVVKASPEHDDCAAVAGAAGVPLREVYEAALGSYWAKAERS